MRLSLSTLLTATMVASACGPALVEEAQATPSSPELGSPEALSPNACDPSRPQPDVCGVGELCAPSGQCAAVPGAGCGNFKNPSSPIAVWNAATSHGPVIFDIARVAPDPTWGGTDPETPAAVSMKVLAYWPEGQFPLSGQTFPPRMLWFVRDDGLVADADVLFRRDTGYFTSADRHSVELTVNVMQLPAAGQTLGFFFTDGNLACAPPFAQ